MNENKRTVTILIPCYNEEESLPMLFARLTTLSENAQLAPDDDDRIDYRFLFVDDGSKDSTRDEIREFASNRFDTASSSSPATSARSMPCSPASSCLRWASRRISRPHVHSDQEPAELSDRRGAAAEGALTIILRKVSARTRTAVLARPSVAT